MTETAGSVIIDALREIGVIPASVELSSPYGETGMFYLNMLMDDLSAKGIYIGYTYVSSLMDELTIPDEALDAIVKLLALTVSPLYFKTIQPELYSQARESYVTLQQIAIRPGNSMYPSTLPGIYWDPDEPILTELEGEIRLES